MPYVHLARRQFHNFFYSVLPWLKLVRSQALSHHEMMPLVVGADCHKAKEPQALNPVGVAVNDQSDAIFKLFC